MQHLKTNPMRTKLLLFTTICFFTLFNSVFGQTKNAEEFLKFAKLDFTSKSSQLSANSWTLIQPTSKVTENNVTTQMSFYGKEISTNQYYIILEFLTSSKTSTQIEKTSIKLANGEEFDKWVADFEGMGFNFKNVSGEDGFKYAGINGLMIKVGIGNINASSSEWSYEITIMLDNKK